MAAESIDNVTPRPPSLHWAIVLAASIVTAGIFGVIWLFVQANWVRRMDANPKPLYLLSGAIAFSIFVAIVSELGVSEDARDLMEFAANLVVLIALIVTHFEMKGAIEARYGLSLSGGMTAFFGFVYLQYHMRRIARGEHTPRTDRVLS
jgi:hypothetical protein